MCNFKKIVPLLAPALRVPSAAEHIQSYAKTSGDSQYCSLDLLLTNEV